MTFDELNQLVGMKRSEPFDDYFAPMKLSKERKSQRIRLAEEFDDEFLYVLSLMFYSQKFNDDVVRDLYDRYLQAMIAAGIVINNEHEMQAQKFAIQAVSTTNKHLDDPYYYSEDRARLCAEDQANFVGDISDLREAIDAGMNYKTWETVGDDRVRPSHVEVEGVTIPIDEPFELAGGYMMAPHDSSMGVDESEIVMCRCSLSFSRDE